MTLTVSVAPFWTMTSSVEFGSPPPPLPPVSALQLVSVVTVTVAGTNLVQGDTQLAGLGDLQLLTSVSADGKTGSVDVMLPPNYQASMEVSLVSKVNPAASSAAVMLTVTP